MLITGGSRGIGAECAILAAEKGWDVVITYRSQTSEAESVVNKIIKLGRRALAIKVDVGCEQDIYNLFSAVDKEFGRLDALVNNAGVITVISSFIDMSPARIRDVFNVNVVGAFICAQEAIKRMAHSSHNTQCPKGKLIKTVKCHTFLVRDQNGDLREILPTDTL